MKLFKPISTKFLQAILGLLIALVVLTQAAIVPEVNRDSSEQKQEQSDSSEDQQVSKTIAIPGTSLQLNLDYQSYLVQEVFFLDNEEKKNPVAKLILPSAQKALKVLFRRIISPNAP